MTRYFGEIGFGSTEEDPSDSGNWVTTITEKKMKGDVVRRSRQLDVGDSVNPSVSLSVSVSVVADADSLANHQSIRYAMLSGVRWVVTDVEIQRPRLILRLGEVYNGPIPAVAP